jgi:putative DNA primase/helicase
MTVKTPEMLQAALDYEKNGWSVIPLSTVDKTGRCSCPADANCQAAGKHPRLAWKEYQTRRPTPEQIREWWTKWPTANLGLATGGVSGIIVLDVDGAAGEETLRQRKLHVPATVIAKTGGGGWHYLFKHPGFSCYNFASKAGLTILPKVDFRGDGGLIVAPPSLHKSGRKYEWAMAPDMAEIAAAPEWLLELIKDQSGGGGGRVDPSDWEREIPEGERNGTLTRLAGSLFSKGNIPAGQVLEMIWAVNTSKCKPSLERGEVEALVQSVQQTHDRKNGRRGGAEGRAAGVGGAVDTGTVHHLTDLGNARRFVNQAAGTLRFLVEQQKWIHWTGKRWEIDRSGEALRAARQAVQSIYSEAAAAQVEDMRKAIAQHAVRSEAESKLAAMVSLARSESEMPITLNELDRDPWLLNCENGTLDLKNFKLLPHKAEDFITKMCPVAYEPRARSSVWEAFLERILPDPGVRRYVQRAAGYSLTGDVSMEKLFFAFGPPATGKTTFLSAVATVLGDYAATSDFESFLQRDHATGAPRNDIARLVGKRFVQSVEVADGQRFAEALINQLTGGDTISARLLYQEAFEFKPQFKIWLAANNRPRVSGPEGAIWRRLVQIPFLMEIPENERDPGLKARLCGSERAAVLAWLVEGCRMWQAEGLREPGAVKDMTQEYREESDVLRDFIEEKCTLSPTAQVRSAELWAAYQDWAKTSGERYPLGRKRFSQALFARGLDQYKSGDRIWIGIGLLSECRI